MSENGIIHATRIFKCVSEDRKPVGVERAGGHEAFVKCSLSHPTHHRGHWDGLARHGSGRDCP